MPLTMDLGFNSTINSIDDIDIPQDFFNRIKCGIFEIDNLFGEGLTPGSVTNLTAKPGSGKTTLLLQMMHAFTQNNIKCGYISGEESIQQIALTAKRINVKGIDVANMNNVDDIVNHFDLYNILVIDSFQCLHSNIVKGKTKTEQYSIQKIVKSAKLHKTIVFNILHMTKDGKIKCDSTVTHAVDCNMSIKTPSNKIDIEMYGRSARIVEIEKNRFGPTGGTVFRMTDHGFDLDSPIATLD